MAVLFHNYQEGGEKTSCVIMYEMIDVFMVFLLLCNNFVGSHGALQHPHDIHTPGARERKYITSD